MGLRDVSYGAVAVLLFKNAQPVLDLTAEVRPPHAIFTTKCLLHAARQPSRFAANQALRGCGKPAWVALGRYLEPG